MLSGRTVLEGFIWWAACVAIWLLSLSAFSYQEFVVAMSCALPCAVAAVAARRAVEGGWRFESRVLGIAMRLPRDIVVDSARVLSRPWSRRRIRGQFRTVSLEARGDSPQDSGRRAVVATLLSTTPGSYVVDTDPEGGTALVHTITPVSAIEHTLGE